MRGCTLCGAEAFDPVLESRRFGVLAPVQVCTACGLVQQHPTPSQPELDVFYREEYRTTYSGSDVPTDDFVDDQVARGRTALAWLRRLGHEPRAVLDVGSGAGGQLVPFAAAGASVLGLEPGTFGAWGTDHLGVVVEATDLATVASRDPGRFDTVLLSFVLEHLLDPVGSLHDVRTAIGDDGHVLIEVPDLDGFTGDTETFFHRAHIWYWTAATLDAALARVGLEIVARGRPGYALSLVARPTEPAPALPLPRHRRRRAPVRRFS